MQFQENTSFLPTGYKFRPSDDELVGCYLHNKIYGLPLSCGIVKDCDLYGTQEIWEIWESYGGPKLKEGDDLYFFTRLKKKSAKSSRICRKVGTGTWEGEDSPKSVTDEKTNMEIGYKKRFRYENKNSEHHRGWIMHQYSLLGNHEFVLCRIRKNDNDEGVGKRRKRKAEGKECVGKRRKGKGDDEENVEKQSSEFPRAESEALNKSEPEPEQLIQSVSEPEPELTEYELTEYSGYPKPEPEPEPELDYYIGEEFFPEPEPGLGYSIGEESLPELQPELEYSVAEESFPGPGPELEYSIGEESFPEPEPEPELEYSIREESLPYLTYDEFATIDRLLSDEQLKILLLMDMGLL